jgi:arabinofuranosyltransferase
MSERPLPSSGPAPAAASGRPRALAVAAALVALAYCAFAVVRLAWVGDDAYITFRTVENAVAGHGLRWNVADRVQTYTHPLWLLLLLGLRCLGSDLHGLSLVASGLCMVGVVVWLWRLSGSLGAWAAALMALAASRAATVYATSGLENPLVAVLLLAFVATWLTAPHTRRRLGWLSLWASLSVATRMDTAVLYAPALLVAGWRLGPRSAVGPWLLGGAPFLLWLAFATFYYGTPWPSTAYAKAITVGLPRGALLAEGLHYLGDVVQRDPWTALVVVLGLLQGLFGPHRARQAPLALGGLGYLGYVVWIGGDFMALRFAMVPFVLALALASDALRTARPRRWAVCAVLGVLLSFVPGLPDPFRSAPVDPMQTANGPIVDERWFFEHHLGLFGRDPRPRRDSIGPLFDLWGMRGRVLDVQGAVGQVGYCGGPRLHLVDPWLCDPLLVRLPIADPAHWRVGHYTRRIPEGYLESLATGENRIVHPALAEYWAKVQFVAQGPLWSWARLGTAWELLIGQHDHLLARYVAEHYRTPPRLAVEAAALPASLSGHNHWFDTPCWLVADGGLEVRFAAPVPAASVTLWLDGGDHYHLDFVRGGVVAHTASLATGDQFYAGFAPVAVPVPEAARGFEQIVLRRAFDAATQRQLLERPEAERRVSRLVQGTSNDSVWALAALRCD